MFYILRVRFIYLFHSVLDTAPYPINRTPINGDKANITMQLALMTSMFVIIELAISAGDENKLCNQC